MKDNLKGIGIWWQRHYEHLKATKPSVIGVMRINSILTQALFLKLPDVSLASTGSRNAENGKTGLIPQKPGDIIYFDWDNKGSAGNQDGLADHVGIVEKVVDDKIYTIEGNSGDSCAKRTYTIGYYELLGFGVPAY